MKTGQHAVITGSPIASKNFDNKLRISGASSAVKTGKSHLALHAQASIWLTTCAICVAKYAGTALPTWWYCSVLVPMKK